MGGVVLWFLVLLFFVSYLSDEQVESKRLGSKAKKRVIEVSENMNSVRK